MLNYDEWACESNLQHRSIFHDDEYKKMNDVFVEKILEEK